MTLVSIDIEIDSDLKDDAEFVFGELGFTLEQAVRMFLDKCVEVGGIPFDFEPEWLIDDNLPFDREIVDELSRSDLRGNDLLLARKERRLQIICGAESFPRGAEDALGEDGSRRSISFEESMAEFGIARPDLDAADDPEIE